MCVFRVHHSCSRQIKKGRKLEWKSDIYTSCLKSGQLQNDRMKKRCKIKSGSKEMAIMIRSSLAKILIATIKVSLVLRSSEKRTEIHLKYYHSQFVAATFSYASWN